MNELQRWLRENGVDETQAMNALQDSGPISDLCVTAADVPDWQCGEAIDRLEGYA